MCIMGVDGCRGGWIAAIHRHNTLSLQLAGRFAELPTLKPAVLAVDMPIGLPARAEPGGRECDRQARRLLGEPRRRSVFSPPVRQALAARSYAQACTLNRNSSPHGIRLSRQAYALLPKIREIDEWMTPERQRFIKEAHPELIFYEMNGGFPMRHPKRTLEGQQERRAVLLKRLPPLLRRPEDLDRLAGEALGWKGVALDDVFDALATLWTARRIAVREAVSTPQNPPRDAGGLCMEIWR